MGVEILSARKAGGADADLETHLDRVTVRSVDDIRAAAEFLNHFALAHGLRAALCADVADKNPMRDASGEVLAEAVFGWSAEGDRWWTKQCQGLNSPLARACRYESEPFWGNREGFHLAISNHYLDNIDIRRYFSVSPVSQSAIIVPVHLPFAQVSANSFHPIDRSIDDLSQTYARIGGILGAITRRFTSGYVSATRTKRRLPSGCVLSKREVECLRWAAIGKTDQEIATIIGLSHAAVRYHLHGAGEKLNSINRAQSVFKAGQLGFLGPSG
ncbi:MAG TPA: LuxR C-terminal-related transcriptional regulator [Hyphomicrobiaceae bacterium]|nr:LuxR C-terminal-related transcriptional regulator [Hyphomicrobiaceae bacterium]